MEMMLFSDLSYRRTQLRQVVGRLALKTLVYHPVELVRDPICHIEPVQFSMKELCQTMKQSGKERMNNCGIWNLVSRKVD